MLENEWFEEQCGQDNKDWVSLGEFEVLGVYGEGIGT